MSCVPPTRRRRLSSRSVPAVLALLAVVPLLIGALSSPYSLQPTDLEPMIFQVTRGEFLHEVAVRGELESSVNVEVRCEVRSRSNAWTRILEDLNIRSIAMDRQSPATMFIATWGAGVWKTTNSGTDWLRLGVGSVPTSATCQQVSLDATDSDVVYAIFQGHQSWVSRDSGTNWSQVNPTFEGFSLVADPVRSGFAYAAGGWSFPKRCGTHGRLGWRDMANGWDNGWFAVGMAVGPNDPAIIYGTSYEGGILRWIADVASPSAPTALQATATSGGIRWTGLRSEI